MPSPRRAVLAAVTLLAAAAVSACSSFTTSVGGSSDVAVEQALLVGVDGFRTTGPPAPPSGICDGSGDVPKVDASLGRPVAAGFTDGNSELYAWAWATSSGGAAGIVDDAVAHAGACDNEVSADYDTNGDGELDSGTTTVTNGSAFDRYGWTGVTVHTEENGRPVAETRYVRRGDLVLLVTLTAVHGEPDSAAIVDRYLQAVAAAR
jgi:hypothetical protein